MGGDLSTVTSNSFFTPSGVATIPTAVPIPPTKRDALTSGQPCCQAFPPVVATLSGLMPPDTLDYIHVFCVVIPLILDVRLVDAPAGVIQEKGHIGFLRLPSAVLALFFFARRI